MATNDFLAWAVGGSANVESQASYVTDATVTNGFAINQIPPSPVFNKALRQATFVAAALAQFMTDNLNTNVQDSGVVSTFEAQLRSALGYVSGTQVWSISTTSLDVYQKVNVHGSSSGVISLTPQAAAGTYNWNYPITAGSAGQPLVSQGGGATAMTWGAVTGTGNFVLSASPTFTGIPITPGMRTGTFSVNGGAALTINTYYTCIPVASIPLTGWTMVWVEFPAFPADSLGALIFCTGTGGSGTGFNIVSMIDLGGGATPFQFDGSHNLQVRTTFASLVNCTCNWTALTL